MEFSIKKCGVLKIGHNCVRLVSSYKMSNKVKVKSEEKDLEITVTDKLFQRYM